GLPLSDATGGFKCFRRQVLERVDLDAVRSNGYAFQIEMSFRAWKKGFRLAEVPIVFTDRDLRLFFEYRQTNDGGGEPLLARYVLGATGIGLEAAASPTGGLRLRLQVPGGCVLGVPDR
ncbi:MAG TPA: hypothetical protein PLI31_05105, partial [Methanoregulaceae archaeon]|nr:hypothetical protein [Methanoregulaceae archaeon]